METGVPGAQPLYCHLFPLGFDLNPLRFESGARHDVYDFAVSGVVQGLFAIGDVNDLPLGLRPGAAAGRFQQGGDARVLIIDELLFDKVMVNVEHHRDSGCPADIQNLLCAVCVFVIFENEPCKNRFRQFPDDPFQGIVAASLPAMQDYRRPRRARKSEQVEYAGMMFQNPDAVGDDLIGERADDNILVRMNEDPHTIRFAHVPNAAIAGASSAISFCPRA